MKLSAALAALLAIATASAAASAQQPWIKDRRYGEGIGIRTGNLELHPGIAAEFGYDSNFFQRSGEENPSGNVGAEPRIAFYRFRVTPHLTLSTLGPQRRDAEGVGVAPVLNFSAGLYAAYNELIKADSSDDVDASDYRHLAAGANFMLDVLPQRPVGFDFYGDYVRVAEPSNDPTADLAFNRHSVRFGTGVNWRPGGGLFSWRLGYEINYHLFTEDSFELLNNARHHVKTRARWRFLPRTAVISDADYGIVRFDDDQTTQNNGETLQARIGINGLVTNHFAILAMGGWGASFYDDNARGMPAQNYDGPVGQAEVKWFLMPAPDLEATSAAVGLSAVALGYTRNFTTSYLGSFYTRDRAYLNFAYLIGGSFVVGLEGGYSWIHYPRTVFPAPNTDEERAPSFGENRIDAQLFAEYRLSDSFAINSTLRYDQNITDQTVRSTPAVDAPREDLEFQRFQAYLGLRLFL
jgi:hypothetical protein